MHTCVRRAALVGAAASGARRACPSAGSRHAHPSEGARRRQAPVGRHPPNALDGRRPSANAHHQARHPCLSNASANRCPETRVVDFAPEKGPSSDAKCALGTLRRATIPYLSPYKDAHSDAKRDTASKSRGKRPGRQFNSSNENARLKAIHSQRLGAKSQTPLTGHRTGVNLAQRPKRAFWGIRKAG